MLSSEQLKKITTEARPIIERQLEDAAKLAGLREVVAGAGGDWSQLKALIKAQIKDENDEAGDGKHVRKLLDKADYALGYADMLGLGNLNEKNSFADGGDDQLAGLEALDPKLLHLLVEGSKTEAGLSLIRNALAVVQGGIEPSLRSPQTTEPAHSDPQGAAAAPAEGSDEPSLPSAIQSTAARMDVRDNTTGPGVRATPADPAAGTTLPAGTQAPPVDTHEAEHSTVSSADSQRTPLSVPAVSDPPREADAQRSTEGPHQPETANETHGSSSVNDEPSPEAGPQAQASHSQGTGAGTLAGREERITGEAASADLPTPSTPDKSGASGLAPAPVTSTQPQVDSGTVADEAAVSGESAGGENVDAAADSAGGRDSSPAVASNIIKIGSGKPLRPFCLHLDDLTKCGGYGKQHCGPCLKAHADAEGLTA